MEMSDNTNDNSIDRTDNSVGLTNNSGDLVKVAILKCSECEYISTHPSNMKKHVKLVHNGAGCIKKAEVHGYIVMDHEVQISNARNIMKQRVSFGIDETERTNHLLKCGRILDMMNLHRQQAPCEKEYSDFSIVFKMFKKFVANAYGIRAPDNLKSICLLDNDHVIENIIDSIQVSPLTHTKKCTILKRLYDDFEKFVEIAPTKSKRNLVTRCANQCSVFLECVKSNSKKNGTRELKDICHSKRLGDDVEWQTVCNDVFKCLSTISNEL